MNSHPRRPARDREACRVADGTCGEQHHGGAQALPPPADDNSATWRMVLVGVETIRMTLSSAFVSSAIGALPRR